MRFLILLAAGLALLPSCSGFRSVRNFRVLPNSPNYVLRSPDARETPFPDILRTYNGFEPGRSWIDLRPQMELRIENAYYQNGASRRGLTGFLGTEVARYEVLPQGLRLLSVQPMRDRPVGQVPVQDLISASQTNFRYYRLYFEIVFAQHNHLRGSVLLGADLPEELAQLSAQISQPETVCRKQSLHCTVFPEACSVSVEIKITVNSKSQTVVWGSLLASIVNHPKHLQVRRLYAGRMVPMEINPHDPSALRLPLLPGDQITWN